jgi:predicted ester cyclase
MLVDPFRLSPLPALLVLVVALGWAPVARAEATAPSVQERNKAIAMRVFDENFNQGRFEVAGEIYAPEFKNHGLHRDADLTEDQQAVHDEERAFPDLHMTVDLLLAEGDLVTAVWTFRGTHTHGGYGGLPATGTSIAMRGITVWRIVDGKIRDEWSSFNELGAYAQVLAHVKGALFAALLTLVALIIALERAAVWAVRTLLRRGASTRSR